ncbi:hypothetical protein [Bradyrhizobium cenepequi]
MPPSDMVASTLSGMGIAGAVIAVLLTSISGCLAAIVYLFSQNNKLHLERRVETNAVVKLIESNNAALSKVADSTDERNKVTQELAEAIKVQAQAFEMVNQRIEFYHEGNIEKLKDLATAFGAHAEAVRANTGMVTEVRNGSLSVSHAITEIKAKIDTIAIKVDVLPRRSR